VVCLRENFKWSLSSMYFWKLHFLLQNNFHRIIFPPVTYTQIVLPHSSTLSFLAYTDLIAVFFHPAGQMSLQLSLLRCTLLCHLKFRCYYNVELLACEVHCQRNFECMNDTKACMSSETGISHRAFRDQYSRIRPESVNMEHELHGACFSKL
jgi:uncharacterized membrane protein